MAAKLYVLYNQQLCNFSCIFAVKTGVFDNILCDSRNIYLQL